jgi:hypothetical protein
MSLNSSSIIKIVTWIMHFLLMKSLDLQNVTLEIVFLCRNTFFQQYQLKYTCVCPFVWFPSDNFIAKFKKK